MALAAQVAAVMGGCRVESERACGYPGLGDLRASSRVVTANERAWMICG